MAWPSSAFPPEPAAGGATLDLTNLPAPILAVVRAAYGDATGTIFMIAAGAAVVALICVVFIREVPLRTTVALNPTTSGEPTTAEPADDEIATVDHRPVMIMAGGEGPTSPALEPEMPSGGRSALEPDLDLRGLDDPSEWQAVAALDVLTAAQDRARQHLAASRSSHADVTDRIDLVARAVDGAVSRFHAELAQIKTGLLSESSGASLGRDGTGGDSLRSYEYGLLLNAQQTADKVTEVARQEAERLLTTADEEVATTEQRIAKLREVEHELTTRVSDELRRRDS